MTKKTALIMLLVGLAMFGAGVVLLAVFRASLFFVALPVMLYGYGVALFAMDGLFAINAHNVAARRLTNRQEAS